MDYLPLIRNCSGCNCGKILESKSLKAEIMRNSEKLIILPGKMEQKIKKKRGA